MSMYPDTTTGVIYTTSTNQQPPSSTEAPTSRYHTRLAADNTGTSTRRRTITSVRNELQLTSPQAAVVFHPTSPDRSF